MSEFLNEFVCYNCQRKWDFYSKKIVREGRIDNLIYITENGPVIKLKPINLKDKELLAKLITTDFIFSDFIPKFGKFEIEKFVADELRNAIFITNNLSYLFNTSIICEGVYISSERIRKELMTILKREPESGYEVYKLNI